MAVAKFFIAIAAITATATISPVLAFVVSVVYGFSL